MLKIVVFLLAGLLAMAPVAGSVWAGTVKGKISLETGKELKNIVVYLEGAGGGKERPPLTVAQRERVFKPDFGVVVQGGSVSFVNDEKQEIDHNVYSLSETKKFDIGLISKGKVITTSFDKAGAVKYYCSIHKNMEGTLIVLPSPYFALLKTLGPFTIANVPPGDWTLKAVVSHRRYAVDPVKVTVGTSGDTNAALVIKRKTRRRK